MEILDGGLATYLVKNGHDSINNDPLWSATLLQSNRESIYNAHKEFCDNGASIVITASYQASVEGFKKHLHLNSEQGLANESSFLIMNLDSPRNIFFIS